MTDLEWIQIIGSFFGGLMLYFIARSAIRGIRRVRNDRQRAERDREWTRDYRAEKQAQQGPVAKVRGAYGLSSPTISSFTYTNHPGYTHWSEPLKAKEMSG